MTNEVPTPPKNEVVDFQIVLEGKSVSVEVEGGYARKPMLHDSVLFTDRSGRQMFVNLSVLKAALGRTRTR